MLSTVKSFVQLLKTMNCLSLTTIFVIFLCALDLCHCSEFQQLLIPSQPARSQFTINDVKFPQTTYFDPNPLTGFISQPRNGVPNNPVPSTEGFLPGLGTYFQPYPLNTPRDVRSPAVQSFTPRDVVNPNVHPVPLGVATTISPIITAPSNPNAFNLDVVDNIEVGGGQTPIDRVDSGLIRFTDNDQQFQRQIDDGLTTSLQDAANGEGKCSFVQMKGTPLPNMNCQKGGMACDKQCGIVDNEVEGIGKTNCETVMEEMCSEVPKTDCRTVNGKVCNNIADEVCEPVQQLEPLTR